jgi:hypothetical protein
MPAKKFMPCEDCPSPAACKKAGKCMMTSSKAKKPQRGGKQALAIMVAVGVPKKGKK